MRNSACGGYELRATRKSAGTQIGHPGARNGKARRLILLRINYAEQRTKRARRRGEFKNVEWEQ